MQKYKIYRGLIVTPGIDPNYNYIGETTDTTYFDESIDLYDGRGGTGVCTYVFKNYSYKITALDSTSKESVRAERDSVSGYTDPCAPEDSYEQSNNPEIHLTYSMSQNYPNPFNPITSIYYSFPQEGIVRIKVYDLLGKEIATLVNEYKKPGEYSLVFNASDLPSGVYFYKITVNNFTNVRKMLLLK